jgi:hypothetical protein
LYETLGEQIKTAGPGPGTTLTHAIETVDNDHMAAQGLLTEIGPNPGTRITEAVETVDNDLVFTATHLLAGHAGGPRPGSRLTASVETMDEDAVASFHLLK